MKCLLQIIMNKTKLTSNPVTKSLIFWLNSVIKETTVGAVSDKMSCFFLQAEMRAAVFLAMEEQDKLEVMVNL